MIADDSVLGVGSDGETSGSVDDEIRRGFDDIFVLAVNQRFQGVFTFKDNVGNRGILDVDCPVGACKTEVVQCELHSLSVAVNHEFEGIVRTCESDADCAVRVVYKIDTCICVLFLGLIGDNPGFHRRCSCPCHRLDIEFILGSEVIILP